MYKTKKLYAYNNQSFMLEVQYDEFSYDDLTIETDKVRNWCKEGCPNFNSNGGCPPFSPTAEELLSKKAFILLTTKLSVSDIALTDSMEKSKLGEKLLCDFMDSLGYSIKDSYGIEFLNPGHCRGCKPCSISTGCKNPDRRVYSITGIGIMLGDVIEKLFDTKLQWFTKDSEPEYIVKIMGFISDHRTQELLKALEEGIQTL